MSDLRSSPRIPAVWRAAIVRNGSRTPIYGRTQEVSLGGFGLIFDAPLAVREMIEVYLEMPVNGFKAKTVLAFQCDVIYSVLTAGGVGFRIGVRIVSPQGDALNQLGQYIQSRS